MFIYSVIIVLDMQSLQAVEKNIEGGTEMKNINRLGILTSIVAVMFILSLFTGIAMAQTPGEKYEKAREKYQERIDKAREKFEDAREKFNSARLKSKSARDRPSRDELRNKTDEYLEKTIDYLIAHLENQKSRIENAENREVLPFDATANIDAYITQLEALRTEVQQANSSEEYIKSARDIEDIAIKIRLETRYYAGILINHRIDLFLEKADNVSARIDAQIEKLKEQGKDTARIEEEAAAFKALIEDAKENYEKILELYSTHAGFDSNGMVSNIRDARAFLEGANELQKDTLEILKDAAKQLRDVFKDAKKLSDRKVVVRGTGKLIANGNGRAVIEGDVTVTLSGNATLVVSGNANVTTAGTGTREVLGNGNVKYHGFGSATINGENIRVEVSGNGIDLAAEGTGSAVLMGNGTYRTEREFAASGEWKKEE